MVVERQRERGWVPVVLGLAMLATIAAAGLSPAVGGVPADTSCPYGACPTPNQSNSPLLLQITLAVLVIIAIALAVIVWSRSRRGGGGAGPPITQWSGSEPPSGASGETAAVEPEVGADELAAGVAGGAAGGAAAAAYMESESDVGAAPPEVAAPPEPAAGAPGGEADIDSLMKELDKISNEILKRRGPKGDKPDTADVTDEGSIGPGSSS